MGVHTYIHNVTNYTTELHARRRGGWAACFTPALLPLYCRFTAALLLLYCCQPGGGGAAMCGVATRLTAAA